MRQKVRRIVTIVSLLLFPVTLNFFSPYVSLDGAMAGVVSGSLLVFGAMLLTGLFFGRAWCSWVCPMSALSELCQNINAKNVNAKRLKVVRYSIFAVWGACIAAMFVLAGGVRGIDPLHLTENVVSVDGPFKYIIYYTVLALFFVLSVTIGKRGACHAICWMSPFLVAGFSLGRMARLPQMRIKADPGKCVRCGACTRKCPMSIDVCAAVETGCIGTSDCILCGACVEGCGNNALSIGYYRKAARRKRATERGMQA